jgi:hypothetical protein
MQLRAGLVDVASNRPDSQPPSISSRFSPAFLYPASNWRDETGRSALQIA